MLRDPFSVDGDGSPKLFYKKVDCGLHRSTSHRNSRADRIVALVLFGGAGGNVAPTPVQLWLLAGGTREIAFEP
jgi:hypothetical protein